MVVLLKCLFVVSESYIFDNSLPDVVGCLGRTQFTLMILAVLYFFVGGIDVLIENVMDYLSESPCCTPYVFVNDLSNAVKWRALIR